MALLDESAVRNQVRKIVGFDVSPHFFKLLFAVFIAACSGDCSSACGGCGGLENRPFPAERYDETVKLSGQIRVTPTGLDFLEKNLTPLVEQAIPGGLSFCLPEDNGNPQICYDNNVCASGALGCDITVSIDEATITPAPTDTLNLGVRLGGLDEELSVRFLSSDCLIKMQSPQGATIPGTVLATVPVKFTVDAQSPTKDVRIDVGKVTSDLSDLKLVIRGRDFLDNFVCIGASAAANVGAVRNLLLGFLEPTIQDAVDGAVRGQLCRACDVNPCGAGSTCAADDICERPDGTCVPQPLGLEGRLLLGNVLADYTEHPEAGVDLLVKVADHASVNDGLTLGLRSGFHPDAIRRCIPADPTSRPDYLPIPLNPAITGNLKPNNQPFMLGFGYHKKAIQHLLWSVWGSGATCLLIDGASISQVSLTGSLFTALLPSLKAIVPGDSSIYIKIVPQTAPDVVLGANTVTANGTSYDINDPLMNIDWKDLDIHIYAFSQERWMRLFTLRGDLEVPVAIVYDGAGQIVPVIGDLSNAIVNIRPMGAELSSEDPQRLADLLPTLIGAALPSLTGSLVDPITLPDLFGLQIQIGDGDITSISNNTMIALYANLGVAPQTLSVTVESLVSEATVDYSGRSLSGLVRPKVDLSAAALRSDGQLAHPLPVEWSYRVDSGFWSMWSSAKPSIEDPVFLLPGKHIVDLRARYQNTPESKGAFVSTEVLIDWDAPVVELERSGDIMRASVSDLVDTAPKVRFRLVGENLAAEWTAWSPTRELSLAGKTLPELVRVDVEVRDAAGHVSSDTQTVRRSALQAAPSSTPAGTPQAGCNSTDGNASLFGLLLALGLFMGLRRRRISPIWTLAAFITVAGCSCDDEETSTNTCDPVCTAGTYCADGKCVIGCESDEECVSGETCTANKCEPSFRCPTGQTADCTGAECVCVPLCEGGCGDNQYCCAVDNACEDLPDPCEKLVCDPGLQPAVVNPPAGVTETCAVTVGTCACETMPPIDAGLMGSYLDIDQNAGVTAISAYNLTYQDLMIGVVNAGAPTFFYVDGLPVGGDIEGDVDGPRGGVKDRGPKVGSHTSVVVDDAGTIHAFYRSEETDSMWYARGTGTGTAWTFDTREFDTAKQSGFFPDAVLLNGEVHVVYLVDNFGTVPNFESVLRHASFAPGDAVNALNVATEDVATGASSNPCGEKCAAGTQCFPSTSECVAPASDCGAACADGTACLAGTCRPTWKAPAATYRKSIAVLNELSTTPDGLLVTNWDGISESVVATQWNSTTKTWGPSRQTFGGPYASGLVDDAGDLHLAYMDTVNDTLVYENLTTGTTEIIVEGVRDSTAGWMVNDIGEDVNLRREADGSLMVSYQDATQHTLHIARRGAGGWTVEELAGRSPYLGSHGFFATLLRAPDSLMIAHFVINQQTMPSTGVVSIVNP